MSKKSAAKVAAKPSVVDVFPGIESAWRTIDDEFEVVYQACPDAASKRRWQDLHSAARDAYWKALADHFADGSSVVEQLAADLEGAQKKLDAQLAHLKDVTAAIAVATEVVRLAAALAMLAATA